MTAPTRRAREATVWLLVACLTGVPAGGCQGGGQELLLDGRDLSLMEPQWLELRADVANGRMWCPGAKVGALQVATWAGVVTIPVDALRYVALPRAPSAPWSAGKVLAAIGIGLVTLVVVFVAWLAANPPDFEFNMNFNFG